jgi:hypothetical protein
VSVIVARLNRMANLNTAKGPNDPALLKAGNKTDACRHPVTLILKRGAPSIILSESIDDRVIHVCTECGEEAWKGRAPGWTQMYGQCEGCNEAIMVKKLCRRCTDDKTPTAEQAGMTGS